MVGSPPAHYRHPRSRGREGENEARGSEAASMERGRKVERGEGKGVHGKDGGREAGGGGGRQVAQLGSGGASDKGYAARACAVRRAHQIDNVHGLDNETGGSEKVGGVVRRADNEARRVFHRELRRWAGLEHAADGGSPPGGMPVARLRSPSCPRTQAT